MAFQFLEPVKKLLDELNPDFITTIDGGFDHVGECRAAGGNGNNASNSANGPQCCGEYPNRFTFNPLGGNRACCGDVTYNTATRDCCNNSFLASIGSCQ